MKRVPWNPLRADGTLDNDALAMPMRLEGAQHVELIPDLFGAGVVGPADCTSYEMACAIAAVHGVMAARPEHTFWLSTAAPMAMAKWAAIYESDPALKRDWCLNEACYSLPSDLTFGIRLRTAANALGNLWLGLRAIDQATLDEGMRHLNKSRASHWWLDLVAGSEIDLYVPHCDCCYFDGTEEIGACEDGPPWCMHCDSEASCGLYLDPLDGENGFGTSYVRLRGEVGPEAKPLHPQWVRDVRDACAQEGVSFEFAWGDWVASTGAPPQINGCSKRRRAWEIAGGYQRHPPAEIGPRPEPVGDEEAWWRDGTIAAWGLVNLKGEYSDQTTPWNGADDVVREGHHEAIVYRIGVEKAGCLLDGREHDGESA